VVRWLVAQVHDGNLAEEFQVYWTNSGANIIGLKDGDPPVTITRGTLDVLVAAEMLMCDPIRPPMAGAQTEIARRCVLRGKAYEAVDSDFASADTSFVTHLAPLADVTNLDSEIKTRCLPILGAGSSDPKLWDSALRTAGVILEERLRDVGGITDSARSGRDLVNDLFKKGGTLAGKFPQDSERQGYRDLYAGLVGVLRNPYAHRLIDPTPEAGGALVVFVDLLLKMLEDLR